MIQCPPYMDYTIYSYIRQQYKSFFQKKISRKTLINTMHSGYVMDYSTAKEWRGIK